LALEFEHRFVNGLQWITALLSLHSRITTPEAAEQLEIAARRVAAFGSVHRRLHLLDNQRTVEFSQFLRLLCKDLSGLLFQDAENDDFISVEGTTIEMETPDAGYSLSVLDGGPGMPAGFDPARCKGLGTKIVLALVKQIRGVLKIAPGDNGRGTRFTVIF
jgi:two-component system, sensor histidine kinase PdtaS